MSALAVVPAARTAPRPACSGNAHPISGSHGATTGRERFDALPNYERVPSHDHWRVAMASQRGSSPAADAPAEPGVAVVNVMFAHPQVINADVPSGTWDGTHFVGGYMYLIVTTPVSRPVRHRRTPTKNASLPLRGRATMSWACRLTSPEPRPRTPRSHVTSVHQVDPRRSAGIPGRLLPVAFGDASSFGTSRSWARNRDPRRLADFWSSRARCCRRQGQTRRTRPSTRTGTRTRRYPRLTFAKDRVGRTGRSRPVLHLDLTADDRGVEVRRLSSLGAKEKSAKCQTMERLDPGRSWPIETATSSA